MSDFVNIRVVGTSHISPESKKRIIRAFNEFSPDVVCVELDKSRLLGLKDKSKRGLGLSSIKELGVVGFLFAFIAGFIQKRLGGLTGMSPGEEMLLAVSLAEDSKCEVHLIDQDVRLTLKKINKIPFKERLRLVWDFVSAPFQSRKKVKVNIAGIPDESFVKDLINQIKARYPYIYRVIIDDRNKIMARRLFLLRRNKPLSRILVVVGEGHVSGLKTHLKKLEDSNISFSQN